MNVEEFRKAAYAAVDDICRYHEQIADLPVQAQVEPGYLVKDLPENAPVKGESFDVIQADFQSKVMPGITHWQHPNFYAYFPAITNFESILGDMYATSVSNPGFNWICSPACTELEMVVVDWAARMLGLDDSFLCKSGQGGGIILGSASESCLTAAIAARERCLKMIARSLGKMPAAAATNGTPTTKDINSNGSGTPALAGHANHDMEDMGGPLQGVGADGSKVKDTDGDVPQDVRSEYTSKLVIYGSTQTHSVGKKAALILGLEFRALPVSPKDNYSLTGATVKAALEEDAAKGLVPCMMIGTVGSTSSGTVDRIGEIGKVLREYPTTFFHIDSAWAGVAYALPEFRDEGRLNEVNTYAHSFCTNFHKWGLTAFDCSTFWVRDRELLSSALDVTPAFLRSKHGDAGTVIDYRNWQIALGRRFRSVKLWFVLRSYGVEGFQAHLRSGVESTKSLEKVIASHERFELVAPRSLTLLVFRLRTPSSASLPMANKLNKQLYDTLAARKDIMLTPTVLPSDGSDEGVFCIRFAAGGINTTEKDVLAAWKVVEDVASETVGSQLGW